MSDNTAPFRAVSARWLILGLIASLGVMSPYYIRGLRDGESMDILVLYRPGVGDRDYLPLARQFAEGRFSEAYTSGHVGQGCVAFPPASVIAHGIGLRYLGSTGFALADTLTPCAYFLAAYRLIFTCSGSPLLSVFFALFITLHGATFAQTALQAAFGFSLGAAPFYLGFLQSWDLRFPRRFITEIFFLGALTNWVVFARAGLSLPRRWWMTTAAWMAALLQSDVYTFLGMALAFAAVGLIAWGKQGFETKIELLQNIGLLTATGVLLSTPFLIQRTLATHDILERYGVFTTDRGNALPLLKTAVNFFPKSYLAVSLFIPFFASIIHRWLPSQRPCAPPSAIAMNIVALSGICAMPALVLALGQGVQLYHFRDTARTMMTWSVVLSSLGAAAVMLRALKSHLSQKFIKFTTVAAFLGVSLCLIVSLDGVGRDHLGNAAYPRAVGRIPEPAATNYRADLSDLFSFIDMNVLEEAVDLATVDVEVYAWWTGLRGGHSFLPHIFVSALDSDILLERLARFAKINQISSDAFIPWITTNSFTDVHVNWLSGNRYQANSLHTFGSKNDYSPEELIQIARTPMIECWQTQIIPASEKNRLASYYRKLLSTPTLPNETPHFLLLNREFPMLKPDENIFSLIYENKTFQLFRKRDL